MLISIIHSVSKGYDIFSTCNNCNCLNHCSARPSSGCCRAVKPRRGSLVPLVAGILFPSQLMCQAKGLILHWKYKACLARSGQTVMKVPAASTYALRDHEQDVHVNLPIQSSTPSAHIAITVEFPLVYWPNKFQIFGRRVLSLTQLNGACQKLPIKTEG
jgi:hypothetical protein